MRKIAVVGISGSGKTTVSRVLAEQLRLLHVELDALHHGPNWTEASSDELRERVLEAIHGRDGWIVDGNYGSKLGDLVLERADTIVWLDLPLRVCLGRLWRRTTERIRGDVELWSGNRETWRGAFLSRDSLFVWMVRSHVRRRRAGPVRFRHLSARLVRLRSEAEVECWLATQRAGTLEPG